MRLCVASAVVASIDVPSEQRVRRDVLLCFRHQPRGIITDWTALSTSLSSPNPNSRSTITLPAGRPNRPVPCRIDPPHDSNRPGWAASVCSTMWRATYAMKGRHVSTKPVVECSGIHQYPSSSRVPGRKQMPQTTQALSAPSGRSHGRSHRQTESGARKWPSAPTRSGRPSSTDATLGSRGRYKI